MTYSLIIEQYCADAKYVNDIKTWKEVTDFLSLMCAIPLRTRYYYKSKTK